MIRFIFVWIYLFCGLSVFAQYTVKGKITDDTGNILIGANVIIEGTLKAPLPIRMGNIVSQN